MTTLKTLNPLDEAREKGRLLMQERIAQGLSARMNPIERAQERPDSLRRAITAKCYECVGMDGDPGFRDTIRTCTSLRCPLYAVRPYQKKVND
jgi:hypothetical protein